MSITEPTSLFPTENPTQQPEGRRQTMRRRGSSGPPQEIAEWVRTDSVGRARRMIAQTAHDLRTPLMAVRELANLLQDPENTPPESGGTDRDRLHR
ncbi:MAG: histidine kinase dimerization/phospho-acceptor domain-containing protein, partial [Planctomycetota bacterium]